MLTPAAPRLIGVGTATPATSYSQAEVLAHFDIDDERVVSLFRNSTIARRSLVLPRRNGIGVVAVESQGELLAKNRTNGLDIGARALLDCLRDAGVRPADLDYLCCVSSTGMLTPGFSALLCHELGLHAGVGRLDVVGMGCNAGLNGLNAVAGWASVNPGRIGVLLCVEVCSAAYVFDGTLRSAVVNSLFGDGAAAVAVRADGRAEAAPAATGPVTAGMPAVLRFSSRLIAEAPDAMRYDWDDVHGKYSFYLDRDIPYVIGAHVERAVDALLAGTGVRRRDVAHWIVHSGGKKVIDAIKVNLGLTAHDLRHTSAVLRENGNLSSGSFLFSYRRLVQEGEPAPGDYGVLMTMGPGTTIETALVRW